MGVTTAEGRLEKAEIYDVLRNDRRRLAIGRLRESDGTLSVRALSEQVAALETGESPAPRNKRRSVYVSLHQTHLPRLDELGIVDYDVDTKEVTLADRVDEVAVHMEVVPRYGLSWAEYYFALGVLGLGTTAAARFGPPTVARIGAANLAAVYLLVLTLSAAYHLRSQDQWPLERLRGEA